MVYVKTNLFPYRMSLKKREPVQLFIEIRNDQSEEKLVSMELVLPRTLGLDKAGLKWKEYVKIGSLKPSEEKRFYFDIYPKQTTLQGENAIQVHFFEHMKDFKDVERKITKNIDLVATA